jgi:glycerol-3-phosphate acyltransferase PlsY
MLIAIIIFIAYLIGSIPSAVWLGLYFYKIDIRDFGSGNAGATNTFRILGKKLGWVVLICDISKGVIASTLPYLFSSFFLGYKDELLILQLCASFTAVIGHVFPIFANFRGGKGVATALGLLFGVNPLAAGICLCIFLIVFFAFRFVSLGAITAALAFPFISYFALNEDARIMIIFTIVLSVLVIIAHRNNFARLVKGNENKIDFRKKKI